MPYASAATVAVHYRGDLAGLDDVVDTLLLDAAAQIEQGRDLPARIAAGRTTARLIALVEAEMVAGVLRNPDGTSYRSTADTAGPSTVVESAALSATAAPGVLVLTRRHRALLGDRLGGIRTASPGFTPAPLPSPSPTPTPTTPAEAST